MEHFGKIALAIVAIGGAVMFSSRKAYDKKVQDKKDAKLAALANEIFLNKDRIIARLHSHPDSIKMYHRVYGLESRVAQAIGNPSINDDDIKLMEIEWTTIINESQQGR